MASAATVIALNGLVFEVLGSESLEEEEGGGGGGGGGGQNKIPKIKCVVWPNPNYNESTNYPDPEEDFHYFLKIMLSGAAQGEIADSFEIEIEAIGSKSSGGAVQEKLKITLYLDNGVIKSVCTNGDGKDKNAGMELIIAAGGTVNATAALVIENAWEITNGSIGWDSDGPNANLEFSSSSQVVETVGIGAAFSVELVDPPSE